MDRFALIAANRLAGNPAGAAALECTVAGPRLVALRPCLVAIAGGDLGAEVNGRPAPQWEAFVLGTGDHLGFAGRRTGARCYLAVGGSFAVRPWLGSASTYLPAARGGHQGRALRAGDVLEAGEPAERPAVSGRRLPESLRPAHSRPAILAAIAGPHLGRLDARSRAALFGGRFTVGRDADRMGYRLAGPRLAAPGAELVSFGLTAGCVQVPPSGEPIMLMADHHTAGGYPVAACLASSSLPAAAQLLPGDQLEFKEISVQAAQADLRRLMDGLSSL